MDVSKIRKATAAISLIAISTCCSVLLCLQLPVFMDWRSSNSYLFYDLQQLHTSRLKQTYKINVGIDTLFSNGIGVNLNLENQSRYLDSQIVIRNASIDYSNDKYYLQTAIQDFGYGNGFLLYNRNYDDFLYNENTLLNSKWYGIHAGLKFGNSMLGGGIGENDLNGLLCELNLKYKHNNGRATLYGHFTLRDSYYNAVALDGGYEFHHQYKSVNLHSGFNYHHLPEAFALPVIHDWHLINELNIAVTPFMKVILSTDLEKKHSIEELSKLYEICFDFAKGRYQIYTGVRWQNVLVSEFLIPFIDFNYSIKDNLSIGCVLDNVIIFDEDNYVKFGIQTKYAFK